MVNCPDCVWAMWLWTRQTLSDEWLLIAKPETLSRILRGISVALFDVVSCSQALRATILQTVCAIRFSLDWPDAVWLMSKWNAHFSDSVRKIAG